MTRVTTYTVEITHDGPDLGAFDAIFGQYLTEREHPFLTDYAPTDPGSDRRADGYDGPFVRRIVVTRRGGPTFKWPR
jgi:hypothetical protein